MDLFSFCAWDYSAMDADSAFHDWRFMQFGNTFSVTQALAQWVMRHELPEAVEDYDPSLPHWFQRGTDEHGNEWEFHGHFDVSYFAFKKHGHYRVVG